MHHPSPGLKTGIGSFANYLLKKHRSLIQSVPDSFSGLRQVDPIRLRKETFSPCSRRSNLFVSTTPLDGGNHFVTTMEASLLTKVKYRGELSDRKCRALIAQWLVSTLSLNFRIFQVSSIGGVLILAGEIILMIDESEENIQGQPPEAKAPWWLRWLRWVPSWILPNAWQRHSTSSFHSNEQRSESTLRNCIFSSHELRVNWELVVFWSTVFTDFHHV